MPGNIQDKIFEIPKVDAEHPDDQLLLRIAKETFVDVRAKIMDDYLKKDNQSPMATILDKHLMIIEKVLETPMVVALLRSKGAQKKVQQKLHTLKKQSLQLHGEFPEWWNVIPDAKLAPVIKEIESFKEYLQ